MRLVAFKIYQNVLLLPLIINRANNQRTLVYDTGNPLWLPSMVVSCPAWLPRLRCLVAVALRELTIPVEILIKNQAEEQ
jgi:hypothetical protein